MKKIYLVSIFILTLAMLFFPMAAGGVGKAPADSPVMGETLFPKAENESVGTVRVLMHESGEIKEMPFEDYLFSVVAAEMPALYETEALKAQTVAAYTYALYKAEHSDNDYDITDDSKTDQAFITVSEAESRWGENFSVYEEKIRSAVKSVLGEKITYDKKVILAAYHAISSGTTEDAADFWGNNYNYLKSVESEGDRLSPNYLTTAEFSESELAEKLKDSVTLSGDAAGWFSEVSRTAAGGVREITVGGKKLSGGEVRKALALRSPCFEVSYKDGRFTFTVRGYGHGMGMSQYGANYLSQQGKTYKEILLHYYTGCNIE